MNIIYWENIISQHKLPYWQKISEVNNLYRLTVVVPEQLNFELQEQGWETTPDPRFTIIENPTEPEIESLLEHPITDTVHACFSGIPEKFELYGVKKGFTNRIGEFGRVKVYYPPFGFVIY